MADKSTLGVGIVGCGVISGIYLQNIVKLEHIETVALADINEECAQARAEEFKIPKVCSVEELLADPDVDIVLNLTIPKVHGEIALKAIAAGKHVYNEKPLAFTVDEARQVLEAAEKAGVRVGCAPDTVMGGALQTSRKIIDDDAIGKPLAATIFMVGRGPESWHPNPDFLYQVGGGPLMDMGPYYLTTLVTMLGPAKTVYASAKASFPERTIGSGPREGEKIKVETPTYIAGTIDFANGVIATLIFSFETVAHHLPRIEIHGTKSSLSVPDPNSFGLRKEELNPIELFDMEAGEWKLMPYTHGYNENSRGIGVNDMAEAIKTGRKHRANGEIAFHVLEILESLLESAKQGKRIELSSTCEKPEALPAI